MSWHGPQGNGAMKTRRATKRAEAETRNAATPPERRKSARRGCPTGKVRFPDEHSAQVAIVGAAVARNRGKNQRREIRWYCCPMCGGGWHLTSKPDRGHAA